MLRNKNEDKKFLFLTKFIEKYGGIAVASCEAEQWTLDKLSRALIDETADGKKIVVPIYLTA